METKKNKKFRFRRRKPAPRPAVLPNYAFIDAQNLNLGTQRVGWKLDWKGFRLYLKETYQVEKAYLFIGYVPDNVDLYHQMQEAGYVVVLKPTVDMYMSEEELKDEKHVTKGNADAELVLHAMKELQNYDKAVLVSGDGDFFCLVEYFDSINKLAAILAPNSHYSSLYKPFEKYIIVLDSLRKQLAYASVYRGKKPKRQAKKQGIK